MGFTELRLISLFYTRKLDNTFNAVFFQVCSLKDYLTSLMKLVINNNE